MNLIQPLKKKLLLWLQSILETPDTTGHKIEDPFRSIHPERDYIEQVNGNVYTAPVTIRQGAPPDNADEATLRAYYLQWIFSDVCQVSLAGIDRKAMSKEAETCLDLGAIYTALLTFGSSNADFSAEREDRENRQMSALEQVNRHKRLVLLGDPGSGKSTFVNFLTMCLAGEVLGNPSTNLQRLTVPLPDDEGKDREERQPWEHGTLLPLRIVLRDFAATGLPDTGQPATVKDLWQFIEKSLDAVMLKDYTSHLERSLRKKGGIVLLDGLDEVPDAHSRRVQIKQVVEEFARNYPHCRIVVTSRTYAYQRQEWTLQHFKDAVLAPFTEGQIRRFIEHWYTQMALVRSMSQENAAGRAELLKRVIFRGSRLRSLAERPLLLTLMASLHAWRGGSLPEKREELYNDAVDLLLDWWEGPKVVRDPNGQILVAQEGLTELLQVGKDPVRNALEILAFRSHRAQPDMVGTADVVEGDLVTELMRVSQNRDLRPTRLIEYLRDRAGLLIPRGVGVYTFPHRTFQEYLAACYLTNEDYPDQVARLTRENPNRWREVVLLAGAKAARGTSSAIWSLAGALCYQELQVRSNGLEDAWGALLAGQALVETAQVDRISPHNLQKVTRIREWLRMILTEQMPKDNPFPSVERALAGNILAQLGDPRPGVRLRDDGLPDIEWCEVFDNYALSCYPVTNAQYQAFVDDGGYGCQEHWSNEGWEWREKKAQNGPAKYGGEFDLPNHPVVVVSWYEAQAYCRWLTKRLWASGDLNKTQEIRLPSEAEWEQAASAGGTRTYPWGDEIDPEHANYADTELGTTSAVGCFPKGASSCGCEEMAGNVWEWCQDLYDESGTYRVLRGGAWFNYAGFCRAAYRDPLGPGVRDGLIGFRLLRT